MLVVPDPDSISGWRSVAHDTVIEINLLAILPKKESLYPEQFKRRYLEYLAELKARGVKLSIGSDCHVAYSPIDFDRGARMLESVGIEEEYLWTLPPRLDKE